MQSHLCKSQYERVLEQLFVKQESRTWHKYHLWRVIHKTRMQHNQLNKYYPCVL